jgi:hypothetical protein
MPAKSRGKKRYIQKKQQVKAAPVNTGTAAPGDSRTAAATAPPVVKPAPVPATEPPRRSYVGKELLRVLVVTAIVLAILVVLALVLR